jgi:IrrE N-terminal-like domain
MSGEKGPRAYDWAEDVHSLVGCVSPPVDLNAVARNQGVRRLGLRLMVHRGVLIPVEGGFEVYLRNLKSRELDIESPEPRGLLTTRQRHSFAHELAHTFYYRISNGVPKPTDDFTDYRTLEGICDGAARRILLPANLLRKEIRNQLSDCEKIDVPFIRAMKVAFNASYEVTIDRIRVVESQNAFARCILLVRNIRGQAKMSAWHFGASILSALPVPQETYQPLEGWIAELPEGVSGRGEISTWEITRRGRALLIQKFPLGRSGDFLLQVDDIAHRFPSSGLSW